MAHWVSWPQSSKQTRQWSEWFFPDPSHLRECHSKHYYAMKPATQDLATENQQIKHKSALMSASEQFFLHCRMSSLQEQLCTTKWNLSFESWYLIFFQFTTNKNSWLFSYVFLEAVCYLIILSTFQHVWIIKPWRKRSPQFNDMNLHTSLYCEGELINMTRAWDKEKFWVPDRNRTHDPPTPGGRSIHWATRSHGEQRQSTEVI